MVDHFIAGAESGWDFNPRTEFEAFNYAEVDLNSLLYALESNIAYFHTELGNAESELWQTRAQERAERMRRLMKGADGCYYDYNFMQDRLSPVFSTASYYPLFVGLVNEEEAKAGSGRPAAHRADARRGHLRQKRRPLHLSVELPQWAGPASR